MLVSFSSSSLKLLRKLCVNGSSYSCKQRRFATLLSREARAKAITKLSDGCGPFSWEECGRNAIAKIYQFKDFAQAWTWMGKVAVLAEEMNHHPEWKNIYNVVEVTLTTHDCGGISELDVAMAQKMDAYAADLLPTRE